MKLINVEKSGHTAILTVGGENGMNVLSSRMVAELHAVLDSLDADRETGAVIITGAGDKAFVSGADIAELRDMFINDVQSYISRGQSLFLKMEELSKPVIAAINGFALGGGCELAMACDMRICSDNAKFGFPEVKLGIFPGYGGTQRLPRIVGKPRAMRMILTGDIITADEALEIGLVEQAVPQTGLMDEALALAEKITANAPLAVRYAKQAINFDAVNMGGNYAFEKRVFCDCFVTDDRTEGMSAFLEKRTPCFKGE